MTAGARLNELKVPFGLKQGRLYSPATTARGLACECVCPGCGGALIANQGRYKRPYFSHFQSEGCSGGYETSIHQMAKQIIRDNRYIEVPEFRKTLRRKMPTGDVLTEDVRVPKQRLDFIDVRVEQTVNGLRPDLVAKTHDGAEVCIEIFVTHEVSEEKRERFARNTMVEIDLSSLIRSPVSNESAFVTEVLCRSEREWVSCRLYQKEIWAAHKKLQGRVKRYIAGYRSQIEGQSRKEEAAATRQEPNQKQLTVISEIRGQQQPSPAHIRERYLLLLDKLKRQQDELPSLNRSLEGSEAEAIAQGLGCNCLPGVLAFVQEGDWIFNVHRSVWQALIYERFIRNRQQKVLSAKEVERTIVREFGLQDWFKELATLGNQHQQLQPMRALWSGTWPVGFWDRTPPDPYALTLNYLLMLAREGMLGRDMRYSGRFSVITDSFPAPDLCIQPPLFNRPL